MCENCRMMDGWDEVWQLLNTFASGETQKQWSRVEPTAMLGELYWRLAVLYDNQKKMLSSPTSLEPDPQWGALVPDDLIKACADNDELKSRLLAALPQPVPVEELEQDLEQYITLGSTGCRTIAEDVEFNRLHSKFLAALTSGDGKEEEESCPTCKHGRLSWDCTLPCLTPCKWEPRKAGE